jgi:hypothetical protein
MVNRERIVEVEWAGRPEKTAYAVKLLAITENRTGMIAGITGAISDMKTGIRDARASVASDERGHIEVTVEVFDVKALGQSYRFNQRCPWCPRCREDAGHGLITPPLFPSQRFLLESRLCFRQQN